MKWPLLLDKTQSEIESAQFRDHLHLHGLTLIGLYLQMARCVQCTCVWPFGMHTLAFNLFGFVCKFMGFFRTQKKEQNQQKIKFYMDFFLYKQ